MGTYFRQTRAEISLDALNQNLKAIRRTVPVSTKLSVCVKANAYGHGAIEVSRVAEQFGVDYLNVAFLDEAIQLRHAGIVTPILVLGYTPPTALEVAFAYNITLNIFSKDCVRALEHRFLSLPAKYGRRTLKVHVKIDSGMGRLGIRESEDAVNIISRLQAIQDVEVEGLFTHFATVDERDKSYAYLQRDRFQATINLLGRHRIQIPIIHTSNSAAMIDMPEWSDHMVRIGISLYGLYPSAEVNQQHIALKPVLSLKTAIAHCKSVPAYEGIGYGIHYRTQDGEHIATMPVGYADGYPRALMEKAFVLIRGKRVPVVGNICMDQCMVSLLPLGNDAQTIGAGEEVVLIGRQGKQLISVNEVAKWLDTIPYEIICMLSNRIPRVYIEKEKQVKVWNPLLYTYNLSVDFIHDKISARNIYHEQFCES